MERGIIEFKCDACGKTFKGPDIEFAATVFTTPLSCPNCGSRRTMPKGIFNKLLISFYYTIWKSIDSHMKDGLKKT